MHYIPFQWLAFKIKVWLQGSTNKSDLWQNANYTLTAELSKSSIANKMWHYGDIPCKDRNRRPFWLQKLQVCLMKFPYENTIMIEKRENEVLTTKPIINLLKLMHKKDRFSFCVKTWTGESRIIKEQKCFFPPGQLELGWRCMEHTSTKLSSPAHIGCVSSFSPAVCSVFLHVVCLLEQ